MTAEFLRVLGAKPHLGRWFLRSEEENGAPGMVILSNSLWRHRFSADPAILGRTILLDAKPHQVVGVAPAGMPFPYGQLRIAPAMREAIRKIEPQVAVPEIRTMLRIVSASVARRRFQATMLLAFALVALLVTASGIYGVLAYTVTQRHREIGIRMALGARPLDVRFLVLGQGLKPVGVGLVLGLIAAGVLTRLIANLLFEVRALDPLTFATVPLLLFFVAILACYLPARQAATVDPLTTLRQE